MKEKKTSSKMLREMKTNAYFFRILYVCFCLFGIYNSIALQFGEAAMNFGIALAFDPFDLNQTWKDRPMWQKIWLFIHLGICATMLGLEIGIHEK
jgi:hypothetical protein